MRKILVRILVPILVLALVAGGVYGGLLVYKKASAKPVSVYSVSDVSMTDYWADNYEYYGEITSDKIQKIYLSDTQSVKEILVTEGQEVRAGDVLFIYDTTLSDIDLEKAENGYQKLLAEKDKTERELKVIQTLRPYTEVLIIPEQKEIVYVSETTPQIISGSGTMDDPLYVLFGEADGIDNGLMEKLIAAKAVKEPETEPEETSASETETSSEESTSETESLPETTEESASETTAESEEETGTASESASESEGESSSESEPENGGTGETTEAESAAEASVQPAPAADEESGEDSEVIGDEYDDPAVYAAFVTRDQDALNGEVLSVWGLSIEKKEDGSYMLRYYDPMLPAEVYEAEVPEEPYYISYGSSYTAAEIASMRAEAEEHIKDLEKSIKLQEVELERLKLEVDGGQVTAEIDGVVKNLLDPDESLMSGDAFMEISAGGGYYINASLSEYDLSFVYIGMPVTVTDWEYGGQYEGTVASVSTYPSENNDYYGGTSTTYYPFTVFVGEEAELHAGYYASVSYSYVESTESALYLQNEFLRNEGGKSYVYVKGADGKLEKRTVQTGRDLWGSYTLIRGGLTLEDRVAFPYGNDVTEGAETKDAELNELYESMYY